MPNLWGARRSIAEAIAYICLGKHNDAGRAQQPPARGHPLHPILHATASDTMMFLDPA
jgi:hypothetical protein